MSGSASVGSDGKVTETGDVHRVGAGGNVEQVNKDGQEQAAAGRPEGLPEGFATMADFTKAYEELKAGKTPGEKKGDAAQQQQQQQKPADENNDPRFVPFTKEFADTGTLSEESKKKAAETFGVPMEVVEQYLDGAKLRTENSDLKTGLQAEPFYELAGSPEKYAEFQEWAGDNLSEKQHAAFNSALANDPETALEMFKAHHSRFAAAGNSNSRDITRGNSTQQTPQGAQPFKSLQEQKTAQGDPRYEKDPAFRKEVEQRIAVSNY